MAGERNTIRGTVGMDTRPAKESLNDLERFGKGFGERFSKVFALEPLGVRRGAHALAGLAEGIADVGTTSEGTLRAVSNLGRSFSVGLGGAVAVGAVAALAKRMVDVNEAATAIQTNITNLTTKGLQTAKFEALDEMRENLTESSKQADELRMKLRIWSAGGTGGLGFIANLTEAAFQGKMPGTLRRETSEQIAALNKNAGDQIGKIAEKNLEIAKVEETRFRVGEKESALLAEDIKNRETLGKLSEEETLTHTRNNSALAEEGRRHNEAVKQIELKDHAIQREMQLNTHNAEVQLRIANLSRQGLTRDEQSVALAREKLSLAQQELAAAKDQAEEAKLQGREEQQRAAARLTRAQAGVIGAGAGVAEATVGRIERQGAEEAMSPQEKNAQYAQRVNQMQGLRQAAVRAGLRADLIPPPRFGEAEYDPTAALRSALTPGPEPISTTTYGSGAQADATRRFGESPQGIGSTTSGPSWMLGGHTAGPSWMLGGPLQPYPDISSQPAEGLAAPDDTGIKHPMDYYTRNTPMDTSRYTRRSHIDTSRYTKRTPMDTSQYTRKWSAVGPEFFEAYGAGVSGALSPSDKAEPIPPATPSPLPGPSPQAQAGGDMERGLQSLAEKMDKYWS